MKRFKIDSENNFYDSLIEIKDLSRDFFEFCEYNWIPTENLKKNFLNSVNQILENNKNFVLTIFSGSLLKGFCLMEYLKFDSDIFGFNIYRISNLFINGEKNEDDDIIFKMITKEIDRISTELEIKYLVISISSNYEKSSWLLNNLIKSKFYFINTLLTFKFERSNYKERISKKINNDIIIREARVADVNAICDIAYNSYKINRYHLDLNLSKERCSSLYSVSVQNSILKKFADIVFVAVLNNEIVGYYSGKKKYFPDLKIVVGNAVVSSVKESARGRGIFTRLNSELLNWFYLQSDISEMGTYLTNTPIIKTWIKSNLTIVRGNYQLAKFYN